MAQINISLPEGLKAAVERAVTAGKYASPSDYVRDLIRRDEKREELRDWLEREVDRGFDSGVSRRSLKDILADYRDKLEAA